MNNLDVKKDIVNQLTEDLKSSEAILVSGYSGISVNDLTTLRKSLTKEGLKGRVIKNSMVSRTLDSLGYDYPSEVIKGQNIYFYTESDVANLTKIISDYNKENENLTIKGGFLNGDFIDQEQIKTLAKLPSKEQLIAKVIGLIKSPISGLVGTLSNPINSFVSVLNNIKNNK